MQVMPGPLSTTGGPDLPPETGRENETGTGRETRTGRGTRNGTATNTALGRISHKNKNLLNSYFYLTILT